MGPEFGRLQEREIEERVARCTDCKQKAGKEKPEGPPAKALRGQGEGNDRQDATHPASSQWGTPSISAALLQDPFTTVNRNASEDSEAEKGKKPFQPGHIRDNAFLVEEAANQEAGVAQHIFNWVTFWDRTSLGRTRDFAWVYTLELPMGTQKHQFSFTTPFVSAFEKPNEEPAAHQGGMGDTFLNYRYQLLDDDDFLWCAPRLSLILPTGDERFRLGTGQLGYQFNLPISRYGESFDAHFNAGFTYIPNVSVALAEGGKSSGQELRDFNLGASVFWKPETYLHFFVEVLWLRNEELDDIGFRKGIHQVFVNPGVRYAVCQFDEVEWVLGVSVPVGLNRDAPDIGVFTYMSVEHAFRKVNGE